MAATCEYRGNKTKEISFPLGGIGTGCIGLAGNGRLIDWEIFNRPNKGTYNGFTHFAVRAERKGQVIDTRVLQGDLPPPYSGDGRHFGSGPARDTLAGLPHFRETVFNGQFPLATIRLRDPHFPGRAELCAWNPFIPLNDIDSSIPAAFFEIRIRNTTRAPLVYTIIGNLGNPLPDNSRHTHSAAGGISLLHLTSDAYGPTDAGYGDLCIATDAKETSFQRYWHGGRWFDTINGYWHDVSTGGRFRDRRRPPQSKRDRNHALLAAHLRVGAGRTATCRFLISWNFPNSRNYWSKTSEKRAKAAGIPTTWRNYYASLWKDSRASGRYALRNWKRLYGDTLRFKDALFASSLPPAAIEAVSANLSVLKSPTVLRLEDGTFYGWEGCWSNEGSCEGSCTHVWNYAQALPFLFPSLERSMRTADYRFNQQRNGGMPFRLQLPLGLKHPGGRSCADGLFGDVLKAYRDWKISGDTQWLRELWPFIKKSIAFAWHPGNSDRWDPGKTGVLWGRQHHTLDMELFGPNSWLTGFYLAALKAAVEIAEFLGEPDTAERYRRIFNSGKQWMENHLFNGEYYCQDIDLKNKAMVEDFDALERYWDTEHGQIKYQIGEGCATDQVLAQWHANLYGLGNIFHPRRTKKALRAVYRHNFQRSMRNFFNACRLYSLNDEAGCVVCTWPGSTTRPVFPLTYAEETMCGFEYAAAELMIQSGMIREGMDLVRAVRDRHDGEKRNPWNEFECGNNYARSTASYALLNAFSGFLFDMVKKEIGFHPVEEHPREFRTFWSLNDAWGDFVRKDTTAELRILYGKLKLKSFSLGDLRGSRLRSATANGKRVPAVQNEHKIEFRRMVTLRRGQTLRLRWTS